MYLTPQPYRCIKCGYEKDWSPQSHHQPSPVIDSANPVCPQCWSDFLRANLGIMYCTVNWGKGSDYDNMKESVAE